PAVGNISGLLFDVHEHVEEVVSLDELGGEGDGDGERLVVMGDRHEAADPVVLVTEQVDGEQPAPVLGVVDGERDLYGRIRGGGFRGSGELGVEGDLGHRRGEEG